MLILKAIIVLVIVGGMLVGLLVLQRKDSQYQIAQMEFGPVDVVDHFDWITPTLAIGSFDASRPPQCWEQFGAILNMTTVEHDEMHPSEGNYLQLGFVDGDPDGFEQHLPNAIAFLQEQQSNGVKTLVHCAAGMSRSVSTVLAFFCELDPPQSGKDITKYLQAIQMKRKIAYPNQFFLDKIAKRHNVDSPKVGWEH